MIFYWGSFIATLGHIQPWGCRLDTPSTSVWLKSILEQRVRLVDQVNASFGYSLLS